MCYFSVHIIHPNINYFELSQDYLVTTYWSIGRGPRSNCRSDGKKSLITFTEQKKVLHAEYQKTTNNQMSFRKLCPKECLCVEVNKSAYCSCEYCINAEFNLRALKKTSLQNLCVLRTTTKCAVIGLILCSCVRYRCIAQLENVKIVELPSFKKHLYLL